MCSVSYGFAIVRAFVSWVMLIIDGNTELQESSFKGNDTVLIFLTGQDFHLKYQSLYVAANF